MSVPAQDPQQLIKRIGRALLGAAPPNWKQIRVEYRSAGRHIEADVVVTADDEQHYPIRPPMDVVELLGELRALMYRPGRGTWMSGRYVLDHPSKYNAEFEPDIEPRWRRVPPPIGFQDELRRFPREDAHIPEWLRTRAGLPPLAEPTPTPPSGIPQPEGAPSPAAPPPSGPLPHPGHTPPGRIPQSLEGWPAQETTAPPPNTPPGGIPLAVGEGPGADPHPSRTPPGQFPPSFEGRQAGLTPAEATSGPPPHTPPSGLPEPPQSRPAEHNQPGGVPFPQQGAALTHTPPAGMPIPSWGAPPEEGATPPERP
ncbi:hypothetical protein JOF56_011267 [Kibdelosporangium banguiense]|uniref:Uncharacterized protein n=1 Tax=Kibdelosporangium banguiense TaxID=1365924 RepID=A0ABS4U2J2_9PSEU|nr:hypothetical protein [Kibdelosporangium banguiense]MBP2330882.1 hypothetical protein [Kibdelosporangium banguiense]